MLKRRPGDN